MTSEPMSGQVIPMYVRHLGIPIKTANTQKRTNVTKVTKGKRVIHLMHETRKLPAGTLLQRYLNDGRNQLPPISKKDIHTLCNKTLKQTLFGNDRQQPLPPIRILKIAEVGEVEKNIPTVSSTPGFSVSAITPTSVYKNTSETNLTSSLCNDLNVRSDTLDADSQTSSMEDPTTSSLHVPLAGPPPCPSPMSCIRHSRKG